MQFLYYLAKKKMHIFSRLPNESLISLSLRKFMRIYFQKIAYDLQPRKVEYALFIIAFLSTGVVGSLAQPPLIKSNILLSVELNPLMMI